MENKVKLTKKELARIFAKEYGYTIKDSTMLLDDMLDLIVKTVNKGYEINLVGFGKFTKRKNKTKRVLHPITKEEITIKAYSTMAFSCSEVVRDLFNNEDVE